MDGRSDDYQLKPRQQVQNAVHNGQIAGGNAPIAGRPWELLLFVRGFALEAHCARFCIGVAKASFEQAYGTDVERSRDEQVFYSY